ncbi:RNB-like protein [Gregarina niphandrodes]|uniref:RNB-like protein n=1 Tax=Gregarina niphandrodes TaxID=110365 RepID=A0A023B1M6_GRENI|nr:RNB-like protein [Gregarina niphandrodes]EZG48223.1 RNB-like protein [Gregarina niphandrodes]|eukprot:XP_011132119.1 RNB-like protein [Gregarina niphandrodes]
MDTILNAICQAEAYEPEGRDELPVVCIKANARGRLRTELEDMYLQENLPCGIHQCRLCNAALESSNGKVANDRRLTADHSIWLLDLPVALNCADFLWDEPAINNGVVIESHLELIRRLNVRVYLKLLKLCRIERDMSRRRRFFKGQKNFDVQEVLGEDRAFYLYPDSVSADTHVAAIDGETKEEHLLRSFVTVAEWYCRHLELNRGDVGSGGDVGHVELGKAKILTSNNERRQKLNDLLHLSDQVSVVTMQEFMLTSPLQAEWSKAGNVNAKIVYDDDDDDAANDDTIQTANRPLYPPYYGSNLIASLIHTKKAFRGTLVTDRKSCMQGRVVIRSKSNADTGVSNVGESGMEIQIVGALNINRAMNRDTVIVEILTPDMGANLRAVYRDWHKLEGTESFFISDSASSDHVSSDHVSSNHVSSNHVSSDHVSSDHVSSNHVSSDLASFGAARFDVSSRMVDSVMVDDSEIRPEVGTDVGPAHPDIDSSVIFGRVVAILRRSPGAYCGTLRLRNKVLNDRYELSHRELVPVNAGLPPVMVKWSVGLSDREERRLVFVYDDWKRDSLLPEGHWIEDLGPVNDIDTECKVILREHNVITRPFTRAAMACLPSEDIIETEVSRRIDLRLKYCPCDLCRDTRNGVEEKLSAQETDLLGTPCLYTIAPSRPVPLSNWAEERDQNYAVVSQKRLQNPRLEECEIDPNNEGVWTCSIDPPTCVDIDDALSVKFLPNGNVEVGVHIADVTHYVRGDSALDKEAAERCTTIYLVNQRTDMLPKLLSADLCSLRSGRDRLCFSVFWEMTPDAKIVRTKFFKTVIHSVAAFTYEQAQKIIDGTGARTEATNEAANETANETTHEAKKKRKRSGVQKIAERPVEGRREDPIAVRLRVLDRLAKVLRSNRMQRGGLELASNESKFTFRKRKNDNDEIVNEEDPEKVEAYEHYDTHWLIEEFMLLANISVAIKIAQSFPQCSVLRRHPAPKGDSLKQLAAVLKTKGFHLEFNSSKHLAKSLDSCSIPDDPLFNKLVRQITVQCMNRAVYFCTGDITDPESRRHYALATNLYTHFTSPIRRYADVMVHRLLAAAINWESLTTSQGNQLMVSHQCEKMSEKHMNAQYCQRASAEYFAYRLFSKIGKEVKLHCVVTGMRANGLVLTCPTVAVDSVCPIREPFTYCPDKNAWVNKHNLTEEINLFDHVIVIAKPNDDDYRFHVVYELERKATTHEVLQTSTELSKAITFKAPDVV